MTGPHPQAFVSRTTPVVPPIYQSATFLLDEQSYADIEQGGLRETWYSRFSNPTVSAAAEAIRVLEDAPAAVMTSSGMAAIATTILALCPRGGRIVASREIYGDTRDLLTRDLPGLGIEVTFVNVTDLAGWERALAEGPAQVCYTEGMSNPQLRLADLPALARLARSAGAQLVVDNTFASPHVLHPLQHGAAAVLHSATKFLSGHSDVLAGVVLADEQTITEVQRRVVTFGGCLDPHAAYLVWRGLQTFEVRLDRQNATAAQLAAFLESRADVCTVGYPGLASYPQHELASRLMRPGRRGAMVSFVVAGGDARAAAVIRALRVAREATSLGGVETLASTPFNSSHFSLTPDERIAAGISPGLIRLSVGVESPETLTEDLRQALDAVPPGACR